MEDLRTAPSEPPQVGALVRLAARRLIVAGIENGVRDAEVLLGYALNVGREQLIARANEPIDDRQVQAYERLVSRRVGREPAAYLTGVREFWSLTLQVSPEVLIPRPETELLVESALELARQRASSEPLRILDLGTGSGAVAIALASELAHAELFATDISQRALAVALVNAGRHRVGDRIRFAAGDLFAALPAGACFDLIVSNPPYIRRDEIAALEPEVSRWEPRAALDGGADGLDFYRRIAAQALEYLDRDGVVLLEIGAGTGEMVKEIFHDAGGWNGISVGNDYAGCERVLIAHKVIEAQ